MDGTEPNHQAPRSATVGLRFLGPAACAEWRPHCSLRPLSRGQRRPKTDTRRWRMAPRAWPRRHGAWGRHGRHGAKNRRSGFQRRRRYGARRRLGRRGPIRRLRRSFPGLGLPQPDTGYPRAVLELLQEGQLLQPLHEAALPRPRPVAPSVVDGDVADVAVVLYCLNTCLVFVLFFIV